MRKLPTKLNQLKPHPRKLSKNSQSEWTHQNFRCKITNTKTLSLLRTNAHSTLKPSLACSTVSPNRYGHPVKHPITPWPTPNFPAASSKKHGETRPKSLQTPKSQKVEKKFRNVQPTSPLPQRRAQPQSNPIIITLLVSSPTATFSTATHNQFETSRYLKSQNVRRSDEDLYQSEFTLNGVRGFFWTRHQSMNRDPKKATIPPEALQAEQTGKR